MDIINKSTSIGNIIFVQKTTSTGSPPPHTAIYKGCEDYPVFMD